MSTKIKESRKQNRVYCISLIELAEAYYSLDLLKYDRGGIDHNEVSR